jgi:minor extracellular serine protease Vpr
VKSLAGLAAAIGVALTVFVVGASAGNSDSTPAASVDTTSAIVQLKGDPISTYVKTRPAPGKKIDFNSNTVRSYRAQLVALRNDFKQWLRANAPKAKVNGEFDIAVNAVSVELNGTSLDTLRSAPQVVGASYQGLYHTTAIDPDLSLINAFQAWGSGGAASAGAGIEVGVVDTGIDIQNPCFSDGTPSGFTNSKVLSAEVFYMRAKNLGYTAAPVGDHGTHVSGTIACQGADASVHGVAIPYLVQGVAPAAKLRSYNVFPNNIASARSEDILDALDAAAVDGVDVINMSLGGGASGIQDLLTMAVDDLDQANIVMAISAGNDGPGHYTVGSPGSAARALTAGASSVPHFVGAPLTFGTTTIGVASGDFPVVTSDLTAPLGVVAGSTGGLSIACNGATKPAAGSLTGKIAVISRGSCTFSEKIRNAQDAGAIAAIVVNNVQGDPVAMARGGIANEPTIPAYQASIAHRAALVAANGVSATIGASLAYFSTPNADIMAGFSSQGPTDVDYRVKPDVVAPGVNVLSSVPMNYCPATEPNGCFAFFQGTSMAAPHLAGSAAVLRSQHPAWSAAQVRSAIVNTATQGVLKNFRTGAVETDLLITGAGKENLEAATAAKISLDPVSVSFGAVPANNGPDRTVTVTVSDLGGGSGTQPISVGSTSGDGVTFAAPFSVNVPPGGSTTFTVTAKQSASVTPGDKSAVLTIGGSHMVLYTFVKS